MRRGIQILILSIILMSCTEKKNNSRILTQSITENWIEYTTKDSIPELLELTLKEINKNDSKIADFNEKFEKTDVIINDSLPRKQIRLLAQRNENWRLSYIQGGFVKYYVYVECKIENDSIYDFKITESIYELENNDSIDKLIDENKIILKEIKIRTE